MEHSARDHRVLVMRRSPTTAAARLAAAARGRGMTIGTLDTPGRRHYYGGPLFADHAGAGLGVALLEPPDTWLVDLPRRFTGREVRLVPLDRAHALDRPAFVKPPSSKDFPAAVYPDGTALAATTADLPPDTPVLVSEIVDFAVEFRLYLLDGEVHTGSQYAALGRADQRPLDDPRVRGFVEDLVDDAGATLPSAVVVDVGLAGPDRAPAVVEANMAWFANPYASDIDRALDVVLRAAGPPDEVRASDRRFLRG
ncbi:ATP-grasp domain-containing protein [Actinokineospora pegani]|uniref:ATP-grasp domain-containing protein n=1 Tax=Actinokineospora pegani TaxID=2654637 RepID=UPI0018D42E0F|nr:ATP-grasp domain-containing protein [Actinokineospora pegani]